MDNSKIKQGIKVFRQYAEGKQPKQIVAKANQFINNLNQNFQWSYESAQDFANILIQSRYVTYDNKLWLKLTEKGVAMLYGDEALELTPDLKLFYDQAKVEQSFNRIWNIIGPDTPETNLFYITGPQFYNAIKEYIHDIPYTYNEFLQQRKEHGQSTTRTIWCKEFFLKLNEQDQRNFLDSLSKIIKERQEQNYDTKEQAIMQTNNVPVENNPFETTEENNMPTNSTPIKASKIFISHNHADAQYAKHLVNLLMQMQVKNKDIFCSSYPGCSVPFGKSFLDAIKEQYDQFELLVLYIHSPRYYESPVSLCEMGASWITKTEHRSFLTSDCTFDMLKGVVTPQEIAFQASSDNSKHYLNEFYELIKGFFNVEPLHQSIWETHRDDFIQNVQNIAYPHN